MYNCTEVELFDREYRILNEAGNLCVSDLEEYKFHEEYKKLTGEYKKLLKQSIKIVNISDTQHKYLNELQNRLKLILDNTGQCVFTTNEHLIIDDNYSAECIEVFGKKIEGQKFTELIGEYNSYDNIDTMEQILNSDIFKEEEFKRKVLLTILPEEIRYKNKILNLNCRLISFDMDKSQQKFLFLLTDITEKKLLEERIKDEQLKFETATRIMSNNSFFKKLIKEYMYFSTEGISKIINQQFDKVILLEKLMKEIHTFKGNFSMFGMNLLVQKLHDIEETIVDMKGRNKLLTIEDIIKNIYNYDMKKLLQDYLDNLGKYIDEKYLKIEDENISISKEKLEGLEKRLKQIGSIEAKMVLEELNKLKLVDFSTLFQVYPQYVLGLAKKNKKLINTFNIESEEYIPVDEKVYYKFTKSLVNVFRNAVKHGIELPDIRLKCGKNEIGNIGCKISKYKDEIKIEIFDDGCGIDTNKLKQITFQENKKAKKLVPVHSTSSLEYIFFGEGISTLDEVDELGGRGEGMIAVINELNVLKGKLQIETEMHKGTTLRFVLPYIVK
jgi:two-component system chemotaxis sensor kinase CheA